MHDAVHGAVAAPEAAIAVIALLAAGMERACRAREARAD
jgi:hypothetical protein